MRVGIVNMYSYKLRHYLPNALASIGYDITVVESDDNYIDIIKSSPITHWIFTGSDLDVMKKKSPVLDLDILKMKNKRFLLICYSMESVLQQLGCHLIKRPNAIKERFDLVMNGVQLRAYRNHYTYVVPESIKRGMRLLATYKGDTMTVSYKNLMMTQWHPERTVDGIKMIDDWLKN
jgi:GMP synthase-like glutamine amidotransferase